MGQEKILTVSIAAYNVSNYICEALDSLILDQAHMSKLEVIVVNDGSSDNTLQLVKKYIKFYPETFFAIDKENAGYGSTINVSLAAARGSYFKLLDGDDWYDKEGLCGLIDYLETAEADLVVSPYYEIREKVTEIPHHPEIPGIKVKLNELSLNGNMHFQMHGITVKTDVLRSYDHAIAEYCFYTDIEYLFYCFAVSESISRFDKSVYYYRLGLNGQSVSRAGIQMHYKDHEVVTDRICNCFERECSKFEGTKKKIIEHAVTFSIYGVFNNYMLLKDANAHKEELVEFDRAIFREYPEAYKTGNDSNVVRITRRLGFHLYGPLCAYIKFKYGRF